MVRGAGYFEILTLRIRFVLVSFVTMSTNYPTIAISDEALISFTPLQHATVHFNSQLQIVLAILRPTFISSLLRIYSSRVGLRPATKALQGIWHLQQQALRGRL